MAEPNFSIEALIHHLIGDVIQKTYIEHGIRVVFVSPQWSGIELVGSTQYQFTGLEIQTRSDAGVPWPPKGD